MSSRSIGRVKAGFVIAAIAGVLHAAASLYWAMGGTWLLSTLGDRIVSQFSSRLWLLYPVVLVKLATALAPLWLDGRGWPLPRSTRGLAWLAAIVLVLWGGANTVIANLVLADVIHPDKLDRPGMIGHAWLWDPLFLIWGLALAWGLAASRASRRALTSRPRRPRSR